MILEVVVWAFVVRSVYPGMCCPSQYSLVEASGKAATQELCESQKTAEVEKARLRGLDVHADPCVKTIVGWVNVP